MDLNDVQVQDAHISIRTVVTVYAYVINAQHVQSPTKHVHK